jgi:hypothetical protein
VRAIELLEEHGVDTPDGHVQAPQGLLAATTVNRWLRTWGYDHARMTRAPPSVRFEARHANELWHFDSPENGPFPDGSRRERGWSLTSRASGQ